MIKKYYIDIVSPYRLVGNGLARELNLRLTRRNIKVSVINDVSQCADANLMILYFSHDTNQLLRQLKLAKVKSPSAKIVILIDELSFSFITKLAAVGINALLSRHDNIEQLEGKIELLASNQVTHCPLYLPSSKVASTQFSAIQARLTKKDISVLSLVSYGLNDVEIANSIGTKVETIKNRLSIIYNKLGVSNRLEALTFLRRGSDSY